MPEYLTPGVYYELYDASLPVIRGLRTDITGFVGLAERGPLDRPIPIESWRQFQGIFGSFVLFSFLAYAVKGFFENGGETCYIVRIAGHTAAKASLTLKNSGGQKVFTLTARNEGNWGNRIEITLAQVFPSDLAFSLVVTRDRTDREYFPRLSLLPKNPRYFVRLINEGDERTAPSQWVRVTDIIPPEVARSVEQAKELTDQARKRLTEWLPDGPASELEDRKGALTGGQDGISSLTREDFLGTHDLLSRDRKGLSALDRVDAVGILCMPDIHIQPVMVAPRAPTPLVAPSDPCLPRAGTLPKAISRNFIQYEQPPQFSEEDIQEIQRVMVEHCEHHKDRVAILDTPVNPGGKPYTMAQVEAWRKEFDSQRGYGALYYPWIKAIDPLHLDNSPVRAIPPCGHLAGLYGRTDFSVGVHKAPANAELFWAEDLTVEVNEAEQGVLNPEGINCLRAFPGRGIRVYGARTLSSDPDWRYVNVRRLLLMIEEAIDEATQWAVFEPHNFQLRQLLILSITGFLETLWRDGALVGETAADAFYVRCDETNNPPEVVDQGWLIADIGVRPPDPAEFIIFRVGRTVEEFEVVER